MKIDKKKIVFVSLVLTVLLFMVSYTVLVLMKDDLPEHLRQPLVPELQEEQQEYHSKLEAVDALREERELIIPNIYSENLMDSPESSTPGSREEPQLYDYQEEEYNDVLASSGIVVDSAEVAAVVALPQVDLGAGHAAFFLNSQVSEAPTLKREGSEDEIQVEVNGTQSVRSHDRLELILVDKVDIAGKHFPRNALVYAFVEVRENRVHLKVTHIGKKKVRLKAFDLQDGSEGIYLRNSFRARAGKEVLEDVVDELQIPGVPQVQGVKNLFKRNNRKLKVKIIDQYQLVLKPEL